MHINSKPFSKITKRFNKISLRFYFNINRREINNPSLSSKSQQDFFKPTKERQTSFPYRWQLAKHESSVSKLRTKRTDASKASERDEVSGPCETQGFYSLLASNRVGGPLRFESHRWFVKISRCTIRQLVCYYMIQCLLVTFML